MPDRRTATICSPPYHAPHTYAAAGINWKFEGDNLDRIVQTAPDQFRLFVSGKISQQIEVTAP